MASKSDITRKIKNDISRKSGIKTQYIPNKTTSLNNKINFNAQRVTNQSKKPTNLNDKRTLNEINFNAQRAADQSKKPTSLNNRRTLNEIYLKAQLQRDRLGKRPSNIKDEAALKEINYNAQRAANQLEKPSNSNDRRTLKEINYNAQRAADQLGRRPLNIKDKKALDNELDYNVLPETLKNRSFSILGPKAIPEIPLITGNFLVRENSFIIATENDKLIELDIS